MSPQVMEATNAMRGFLFERVYNWHAAHTEVEKARELIRLLYNYFIDHENSLPHEYRLRGDETERRVVDYIAGMTDQFALRSAEKLSLIPEKGG